MIAEFSQSADKVTVQTEQKHKDMLKLLRWYIDERSTILDIGEDNPLAEKIRSEFRCNVYNTKGDLDSDFYVPIPSKLLYDVIICSHVLEHLFNPLWLLNNCRNYLHDSGTLIVAVPRRTKLLWTKNHYHEIDDYRIRLLFKRAGFTVIKKELQKVWRNSWEYFYGIRPFLRLFLEWNAVYILRKI